MHHLASLLVTFSLQVKISYQNVSLLHAFTSVLVFIFSSFSYSSKSFQIPQECMLKIHCFQLFSEVLNCFKYRHNTCFRCTLFSSISLQFQIVQDIIRLHALKTLFSFFFSAVPIRYRQVGWFTIVEITSRYMHLLSTSQNLQITFYLFLFIQGSMSPGPS